MMELEKDISALIDQLSVAVTGLNSSDAQASDFLSKLLTAIENDNRSMARQYAAQLRDIWLHQVPWCSDLSRGLEKVLIQFDESRFSKE